MKILVMGLPGSGKTTLAKALAKRLNAAHFNADEVRRQYDDWDFSIEGRIRQAKRLGDLCDKAEAEYAIADFVCPTSETRRAFGDAFIVWIDRIEESRYADTNKLFESPVAVNVVVSDGMLIEEEVLMIMHMIDANKKLNEVNPNV